MSTASNSLARVVGVKGAVMMGLGSIVGTGVFVSLGIASGIAGPSMILALLVAGCLATCNGLSTAQLAASHPVSGGTYEYGYKYAHPWLGYGAGWMFMCAKSASAATAAIGFGGYFVRAFSIESLSAWQIGLIATAAMLVITALGMKRSNWVNILIVGVTIGSLALFVFASAPSFDSSNFSPFFLASQDGGPKWAGFFEACALMFVAYTGYGRIATLGEEIKDPTVNIPKAIAATLALSFFLYMAVTFFALGAVGANSFYSFTLEEAAPLEMIAESASSPVVAKILSFGAMTAMLGVLLNLLLGLSRVVYAMGKKGDLPTFFSMVESRHQTPWVGILTSGAIILALIMMKDVKATWSFSAFTVLLYYSVTNLSALRLTPEKRLYPRFLAWAGLVGCLGLSFWVDAQALKLGLLIMAIGVVWRVFYRKSFS